MLEAYMITFLACSISEPLRCKPIQILTDQFTPIGCLAVSQQLTADATQRVRCVPPSKGKIAI
jgi:hypothetical protein